MNLVTSPHAVHLDFARMRFTVWLPHAVVRLVQRLPEGPHAAPPYLMPIIVSTCSLPFLLIFAPAAAWPRGHGHDDETHEQPGGGPGSWGGSGCRKRSGCVHLVRQMRHVEEFAAYCDTSMLSVLSNMHVACA